MRNGEVEVSGWERADEHAFRVNGMERNMLGQLRKQFGTHALHVPEERPWRLTLGSD